MNTKIVTNKYNILHYTEFLQYIEEMNNNGWMLKKSNNYILFFKKNNDRKIKYKIDILQYQKLTRYFNMKRNLQKYYKDAGWTYLGRLGIFFIFSKETDDDKYSIDNLEIIEKLIQTIKNRVIKQKLISILIDISFTIIMLFIMTWVDYIYNNKLLFTYTPEMKALMIFLILCNIHNCVYKYLEIRKLKLFILNLRQQNHTYI